MSEGERKREKKVCNELFAMFVPSKNVKKTAIWIACREIALQCTYIFWLLSGFTDLTISLFFSLPISQCYNLFIWFHLFYTFSLIFLHNSLWIFFFFSSFCLLHLFVVFVVCFVSHFIAMLMCNIQKCNFCAVLFFGVSFSYLAFVSYA